MAVNLPLLALLIDLSVDAELRLRFSLKDQRRKIFREYGLNRKARSALTRNNDAAVDALVNTQVARPVKGKGARKK